MRRSYMILAAVTVLGLSYLAVNVVLPLWMIFFADDVRAYASREEFDSAKWKDGLHLQDGEAPRAKMIDDLLQKHELNDMSRDQLITLLGEPGENFDHWDMVYWVEPSAAFVISDFSEWLAFDLDANGRVLEHAVVSH